MDYTSPLLMLELSRNRQEDIQRDVKNARRSSATFHESYQQLSSTLSNIFTSYAAKQATPKRSNLVKQ